MQNIQILKILKCQKIIKESKDYEPRIIEKIEKKK